VWVIFHASINRMDFLLYLKLGWQHIISVGAWDHILFIIALSVIYMPRDWKQVLVLVTAFTIGHALTLVLSVLDVIRFPDKWVEFLIPCTILITALFNLFQRHFTKKGLRANYLLALGFGLIHGMGFANAIRFMLAKEQSLGWSLLGFNLGLEIGQIFVVLLVLSLTWLATQRLAIRRTWWVYGVSGLVFAIALQMAFERHPF
jgi:hypothetical protein